MTLDAGDKKVVAHCRLFTSAKRDLAGDSRHSRNQYARQRVFGIWRARLELHYHATQYRVAVEQPTRRAGCFAFCAVVQRLWCSDEVVSC